MNILPAGRYQQALLLFYLVFLAFSLYDPPYGDYMLMQHVPTMVAAVVLLIIAQRLEISRLSFTAIIVFLCLHTLGARYLYSYTPYDEWSQRLFGFSITQHFGFQRNHFDRFVHFSFGLLMSVPLYEFERRNRQRTLAMSSFVAAQSILAASAGYELIEWLVTVVFTPEWADSFLGHQGDPFDAQKDTALAMAGAFVSLSLLAIVDRFHRPLAKNRVSNNS